MTLKYALVFAAFLSFVLNAGEPKKPKTTRVENMDFGPFISNSLGKIIGTDAGKAFATKDGIAVKGIVVKIDHKHGSLDNTPKLTASTCFDTDLLRYAATWTDGFVDFSETNTGQLRGDQPAAGKGTLVFGLKPAPGVGINGKFTDGRKGGVGPLPYDYAKYNGLYLVGEDVVFSYSVHGIEVLDMPQQVGGALFFRQIRVGPSKDSLNFALCESAANISTVSSKEPLIALERIDGRECITVKPRDKDVTFTIAVVQGGGKAQIQGPGNEFNNLKAGGKARWKETIETSVAPLVDKTPGKTGDKNVTPPYVVDDFELPNKNPWNAWMKASGFDFFADGKRAALCTLSGDVWIVSGLDGGEGKKVTWRRFATGMYEPLGLKVVDETVYVLGRDQITRLHDLNGDGEADFYENFCSQWNVSPSYHAFSFDLWTDKEGNFYYANTSNQVEAKLPGHGVIFKISKDGKKIEEFATGLRAPNGMAVGPNGEVVCSDNQGYWTPSSKINWVKSGMFLGHPGDPRKWTGANKYVVPEKFDPPLCWIPYANDNSSGGEAFITSDKWGPFSSKQLVHLSYGKCTMLIATTEEVDGTMQGGSWKLPFVFPSGVMRARFNPVDGQLYVCGLKGWQTSAAKDGCFCRVRYTGAPVRMPLEMKTHPRGLEITFTCPLDETSAKDTANYAIEEWGYLWSPAYGSADYKVSNPKEKGRDLVEVEYVNLSADKRTVTLALKDVHPVMQMGIKMKVKAADGAPINTELDYTINKVGK